MRFYMLTQIFNDHPFYNLAEEKLKFSIYNLALPGLFPGVQYPQCPQCINLEFEYYSQ